jgi:4-diphosphocytidyl-2-C-methyl-D-erythritol kinase
MHSYTLLAPAKINLYLEILGDRADGFHELVMIMQTIDLCDRITLRANGTDTLHLTCDHPEIPADHRNLAYRAAALMMQHFPAAFAQFGAVDIAIEKRIPVGAGLAGGSSNAAAVLVGLDLLWNLGLTRAELQELGAILGSDVPFSIMGGTALATGRGEKLDPLPPLVPLYVVLAKYRSLSVATPWAYQTYRQQFGDNYLRTPADLASRRQQVHAGPIMAAIAQRQIAQIGQLLHNDLEKVVLPAHATVAHLRQAFCTGRPLGAMMSGSGPTVFALVETPAAAAELRDHVRQAIADPDLELWLTQVIPKGIHLEPAQ